MSGAGGTFALHSEFAPAGDQPAAIAKLTANLNQQVKNQILLGVTGSGKTFTLANVIAAVNRPTLVLAHNKTLAAQLCSEFRSFFPNSAVEYFVSYYDYYQPEAYLPATDTYIEKDSAINDEIDRLRHSATRSLLSRRDVIVVASVSAIYGLGTPEAYLKMMVWVKVGDKLGRDDFLRQLIKIRYTRNDVDPQRGMFRVRGDTVDLHLSYEHEILRIQFWDDKVEAISRLQPVTLKKLAKLDELAIYPATHHLVLDEVLERALSEIKPELDQQLEVFKKQNKLLEAQRLEQRTLYDIEMIRELGYCTGIENYSRFLSGRSAGESPAVLMDYFPKDYLLVIDESHAMLPQVRAMYNGDRARKQTLIDNGFRLPSAYDNRPLKFEEFMERIHQAIYVSATPADFEMQLAGVKKSMLRNGRYTAPNLVEQIIRPTGLVDPEIEVHPSKHQIDHLIAEIRRRLERKERCLVTTLTIKMSEDLSEYLKHAGFKVAYLHSKVETLDRIEILHKLRKGVFDVLVGINLLREGLDLPEVSLVAILDADQSGFLRNERSLIQTMGRAARNINGRVILYADQITPAMADAMAETGRRRKIQLAFNQAHDITPTSIQKELKMIDYKQVKEIDQELTRLQKYTPPAQLPELLAKLEAQMQTAARQQEYEIAAVLRDQIEELKGALR